MRSEGRAVASTNPSPGVGRQHQNKDPIGFGGGDTNVYSYVANDPVNLVDPEGKCPAALALAAAAGVLLATSDEEATTAAVSAVAGAFAGPVLRCVGRLLAPAAKGLVFAADDLVYGPSARGALRALQEKAGGRLLGDMWALKRGNEDWFAFSARIMEEQISKGGRIHFDLTHLQDVAGVLKGTGEWATSVTAKELRYIQVNWSRFSKYVQFYRNETKVGAPWL